MAEAVAIHSGLFTWPAEKPELLGVRCRDCGAYHFPARDYCARCLSSLVESVSLGSRGTLWSWTIQSFPPKAPYRGIRDPQSFVPYGVGYVEMPCGIKVETRLREHKPEQLRIGMAMALYVEKLYEEDGRDVMVFAFRACDSGSEAA